MLSDPLASSLGTWISIRRRTLLLTQKQLAAGASCSIPMVKKVEGGDLYPSAALAQRLAAALALPPDLTADFVRVARQERTVDWLPNPRTLTAGAAHPDTAAPGRRTIPHPPSDLIGRTRDLHDLIALLQRRHVRLLTLVGPPGIGKTRLALEVLQERAGAVDWATFVDLSPLDDPALVPGAIRSALQLDAQAQRTDLDVISAALGGASALLVLDNYEHVIEAALVVAELLRRTSALTILTTSREPLRLQGEHCFALQPLTIPDERTLAELQPAGASAFTAIALFVARAQAADRHFALTSENLGAVARLCATVDGLPLAIELLAPRAAALSPTHVLSELEQRAIGARIALLEPGTRDAPPRHQSLNDAIQWSYQLLPPTEQRLLRRLAVCAGGFTLEAALAIGDAHTTPRIRHHLTALVGRSLLYVERGTPDRYRMLVTIRGYAHQQLAGTSEIEAARERHAAYYLGLAQQSAASGHQQSAWWVRLDADRENLRLALEWCVLRQDLPRLFGAIVDLEYYWRFTGQLDTAESWIERALQLARDHAPVAPALHARVLFCAADLCYHRADGPATMRMLERCQAIVEALGDPLLTAELRYREAREAELHQSVALLEHSLTLVQQTDGHRLQATILHDLGGQLRWVGRYDESVAAHTASIALYRAIGEEASAATGLALLAQTLVQQGAYDEALRHQAESIEILRRSAHYRLRLAWSLQTLGMIYSSTGDFDAARATYLESYALFQEIGDGSGLAWNPYDRARIELRAGAPHLAEPLLRDSLRQFEQIGDPRARAWCHCLLGEVAFATRTPAEAARQIFSALTLFRDNGDLKDIVATLPTVAAIALTRDRASHAAQLLGAEAAIRERQGMPLAPADIPRRSQVLDRVRAALGEASFSDAWADGAAWPLEQALMVALGVISQ